MFPPRPRSVERPFDARLRSAGLVAVACVVGAFATVTCGGTTGREGLSDEDSDAGMGPAMSGAADDGGRAADGAALGTGPLFDVGITYVDRVLPDVTVVSPAGEGGATYPWPTCPPFIPVGPDGGEIPLGNELDQLPAAYEDGGTVFAAAGSPCATYGWLGSPATDECLTSSSSGWGQGDFALLPPCSWCLDAGSASQGSGAGTGTYDLCIGLYACAIQTRCGAGASPSTCLCGDASAAACIVSPAGPCAAQELAALQYRSDSVEQALSNYTQVDPAFLGYCGSALNYVFQNARANACFAADAGTP